MSYCGLKLIWPFTAGYVTFDFLTLNSCHSWRVTWPTLPQSLKTPRLFVHELRVITFPIDYHWKCVRGHCGTAHAPNHVTHAIFLLPVCLTYWPRKYTTRVDPHLDNSHQVWSWYDHTLPSYSVFVCWYVTRPCDYDLWPFDLVQLSYMASDVNNPATKFEDPTTIRSWVTSYKVSPWLPLKMRTRPLRMRRITWPVSRGSKTITFSGIPGPDLPLHYATSVALRWK